MRIVHTSDWHLGRSFGPVSLAADQAAFIDWFVDLCDQESADLVVIAGDVFDRAIAPTEAVVMFRDALVRLQRAGHAVAVITGNHDGPRIEKQILERLTGDMVAAIRSMTGGTLDPIEALCKRFPNIERVVPRTTNGHAAATPPTPAMNSRRFIRSPRRRGRAASAEP